MTEKRRYKVLLIGPSSPHVANHYDRISNDIFDIQIISDGIGNLPEGTKFIKADFSLRSLGSFFKTPALIKKTIASFEPDVIHVHQANSVAFYTIRGAKGMKCPVVLSAWGSDILINPKKSRLFRWMVRYVLRNVDLITSNSYHMGEQVKAILPERKLDVEICNFGVLELDISTKKEKVVYSNRAHEPLYRVNEVVRAFHRFIQGRDDGKEWSLVIAGKGSLTDVLKKQVAELHLDEQVTFIGFVDTKTNIENYAKAKVYITLPESDAAAVSLMEAMYYRCLPVAYDLPASREHLENEKNGVLVTDFSENMIQRVLDLESEALLQSNYEHIREGQTVAVSRKRFKEVLLKAIGA